MLAVARGGKGGGGVHGAWTAGSSSQSGKRGIFPIGPLMDERRVPCLNPRPAPAAWTRTEWPRMTVESLKDCSKKVLARMAKDQGIVGWHAMRKDQR